jgi:hypothetical protein
MVSDFFALYHLFQGTTKHQVWMHTLDLGELVEKHSEYLHGNPYGNRKVVLDKAILANIRLRKMHPFTCPTQTVLLDRDFKNEVKKQCKEAQQTNDPVLIMIFTHGTEDFRFAFPCRGDKLWMKPETFVKCLDIDKRVKVGLITTACYSGGWVAKENLNRPELNLPMNITSMTAAEPDQKSRSWRWSASLGRYCGSMFVSALVETLTRDPSTGKTLRETVEGEESGGEALTENQNMSLAEFDRTLYLTLLDLDRRGYEHHISFTAQDGSWSENAESRPGIPLGMLQQKWTTLRDWPASSNLHPSDYLNRDPHVPQEKREEYLEYFKRYRDSEGWKKPIDRPLEREGATNKRTLSLMMRGSGSLESWAKHRIQIYRQSNPGDDDEGGNQGLGTLMRVVENYGQGAPASVEDLDRTLRMIDYRLEVMEIADKYLKRLGIDGPDKKSCAEWNEQQWVNGISDGAILSQVGFLMANTDHFKLFPEPNEELGRRYGKGYAYIKAALFCAARDRNWSRDRCAKALEWLIQQVEEELILTKDVVKDLVEVKTKRQKVAEAFKKTLRDLSPIRSQSENKLSEHQPRLSSGAPPFPGNPASTLLLGTPENCWISQSSSQGGSPSQRFSSTGAGLQYGTPPPRFNPASSTSNSLSKRPSSMGLGQQSSSLGQLTGPPVLKPRASGNIGRGQGNEREGGRGDGPGRARGRGRGLGGDGRGWDGRGGDRRGG